MIRVLSTVTLIALMAPGFPAHATSMKLLSLDQLISQATAVVAADVMAKETVWEGRFIKTRVRMKVADCMKGACEGEEVEVETWGGSVDGLTMRVDGATQFEVGEKVVVFLRPMAGEGGGAAGGMLHTVGMAQGKFVPALGQPGLLTRDEIGMHLVGALAPPPATDGDGADDEPDAGVLEEEPDEPATRKPTAGVDTMAGLTMGKLKRRIKQVALIRTPPGPSDANALGAERTVREPLLGGGPGGE